MIALSLLASFVIGAVLSGSIAYDRGHRAGTEEHRKLYRSGGPS